MFILAINISYFCFLHVGCTRSDPESCDSYVWRLLFKCKANPDLTRLEIYRREKLPDGKVGKLLSPVFIQYKFDGVPKDFDILPHGNSRTQLPFHPADKSLLNKLHESTKSTTSGARSIYNKVSELIGYVEDQSQKEAKIRYNNYVINF